MIPAVLGLAGLLLFLERYLAYFRKNIAPGDIVGVNFGNNVILNRKVLSRTGSTLTVKHQSGRGLFTVEVGRVYARTQLEPVDAPSEESL